MHCPATWSNWRQPQTSRP